ncbi:hypothetical protein KY284_036215 [Solanum tuberosum]|nr:hypothetical protein KY284_036215 [Solanum tuberosum]
MLSPSEAHWKTVKHILCYLKNTTYCGLRIGPSNSLDLSVFFYVDWAGNLTDQSSTMDYVIFLGLTLVIWHKKQFTIARSSTEAKYRAVACFVDETTWVKNLLKELHVHIPTPPTIFCDNLRVTYLCENNNLHNHMKHIVVDFHYVHQQVTNKHLIF